MNRINILGIKYCDIDIAEAVEVSSRAIDARDGGYIVAPGSELALDARKNKRLMAAIRAARLILPDDRGIFIASQLLGLPLHYKMNGADFTSALLARLSLNGKSVFLLGTKENDAQHAAEAIIDRYPGIRLAGANNGRFVDDTEVVDEINAASPDLLLVCLSSPKQELWLYDTYQELNVGLSLAVGDAFEHKQKVGFFARLRKSPKEALKFPRMILAALWKRIIG